MTDGISESEAFALQAMFSRAIPPVPDQGFSQTTVHLIRRKIWRRRLILLPAVAFGIVMALPALSQLLLMLSNELLALITSAENSESIGQLQLLLSMLPLRDAAQAVNGEITRLSGDIGNVSWYQQNAAFILAGLAAVISLAATRVLGR